MALLYHQHDLGYPMRCLGFNYGQRHVRELDFARKHCKRLGIAFTVIELYRIKGLFQRSFLTDGEGSKIVPNRNAVFIHITAGIAASSGAHTVTIATNKTDQWEFPDCTKEFVASVNDSLRKADVDVVVRAPFSGLTKWQIVHLAKKNGWPVEDSLSCYLGTNCGKCDACKQRREALK